ncbi:hypothetical protein M758_3G000400 [Ceratodon purpureus]|nr:hypothetical protein M758_3G000400 [Ceratodon purpureus]
MKFTLVHFICRTTRCFRQLQYPLRSDCHYFVEPKREKGYLNRGNKPQREKVGKMDLLNSAHSGIFFEALTNCGQLIFWFYR